MKKLCFVTTVPGTLRAFVLPLAKYMHSLHSDWEISFICTVDEKFAAELPDYIRYIPVPMSRGIDFKGILTVLRLFKIFKKEKFDIVQYSTPNASCYASIASFFARVPVRLYAQWGIRYVGLSGMSRKIFKLIEKMVCMLSTDVRAVSRMNKAFAVNEGLYREQKAKIIGNGGTIGADMSVFDINKKDEWNKSVREKYGISEDDFVFGFAGRISADKGCSELLKAFKNVSENHGNVKLLMIGSVDENNGLDAEIMEFANTCDSVVMTGRIENVNMREYYSAMDVLVHPTYREGFGMVIQEAGALAVPVITTKIPGASEVMEDGVSCILAQPKDEKELENAMLKLLSDKELTKRIGEAAYNRTKELYDRPVMLKNQYESYVSILNGDV